MKVGSTWKYVCDDHFDANNNGANVAFHELGFTSGKHSNGKAHIDSFYDDVKCAGTESRLVDCPRGSKENCGTGEAVTLKCTGQKRAVTTTPTPDPRHIGRHPLMKGLRFQRYSSPAKCPKNLRPGSGKVSRMCQKICNQLLGKFSRKTLDATLMNKKLCEQPYLWKSQNTLIP